jgi:hypothetical protein
MGKESRLQAAPTDQTSSQGLARTQLLNLNRYNYTLPLTLRLLFFFDLECQMTFHEIQKPLPIIGGNPTDTPAFRALYYFSMVIPGDQSAPPACPAFAFQFWKCHGARPSCH